MPRAAAALLASGEKGGGWFTKTATPQPGDIMVWPDGDGHQGHIGIISEVAGGKASKMIHCSHGNDNKFGRAIQETDADIFYAHNAAPLHFDRAET